MALAPRRKSLRRRGKKGFLFTTDALLASMLLIAGLLLISKYLVKEHPREGMEFLSSDTLFVLSEIKMSEINSSFLISLKANDTRHFTDENLSVLEQIGTYWAGNETELAASLTNFLLQGFFPNNTGVELVIGTETLFQKNTSRSTDVFAGDRMITGVMQGEAITGSTSSAYLRKISDKRTKSFAYFGGFVGQGVITVFSEDIPSDVTASDINSMEMELDAGNPFSLYINGTKCGDFTPSTNNMSPDYWDITSCKDSITTGRNLFQLNFSGNINKSYVAGGYIKISYITSERIQNISTGAKSYSFPGIVGIANLYDSFYLPGTLTNMSIKLHFNTTSKTYLTIGDVIVYQNESSGDMIITLNDAQLKNFPVNLNYNDLSNKTIPLRFASYNETYTYVMGSNADVVLITDLSGSMKYGMTDWGPGEGFADPQCTKINASGVRRLAVASCLDSQVNAIIMNSSRTNNSNRLWLVDFSDDANPFYSSNLALLTEPNIENEINDRYKSKKPKEIQGGTCLACAINQAYEILNTYSSTSRTKSVIVMSDGVPTYCTGGYWSGINWMCNETSTGTTSEWPAWWQITTGCTGDEADCSGTDCNGPMNNAINSAARLHDNLNVTVYAVGMGPLENCTNANYTLHRIAEEGNGSVLVSSSGSALQAFYQNISLDVLARVEQSFQLVSTQANITLSTLYNDSYINFTYTPVIEPPQPNEISVLIQTEQFGSCTPTITIPPEIRVADAKIVSYSDYHWTSGLLLDGDEVYNLTGFSSTYYRLGDPYEIQIPVQLLTNGTHTLLIQTADSPENLTGCSLNNSMVYTALVPSATARSGVVERTEGCVWTIQFEDDTNSTKTIPAGYNGTKRCSYIENNYTFASGAYDDEDAYDIAVYSLLRALDFDDNGKVFVNLESEDIEIVITTVSSVPYLWGPTLVKAKVWQ